MGRRSVSAVLALLLPGFLARPLLNWMGHRLRPGSRIGISWVWCDFIALDHGARIGHFNLVAVRRLVLRQRAYLGRANIVHGPLDVVLQPRAALGNGNHVSRAPIGVTAGPAQLWLGELAKITAQHRIDCTQTIRIGAFSTIAGARSQLWTHGYVHATQGEARYRIDGRIDIEDNVYVGSACIISMGVRIARGVIVGGGTAVAKSLLEPGLYVSAPARMLPRPPQPGQRADLLPLQDSRLCETVFLKRRP